MENKIVKPDIRERTIEKGISYPDDEELIMLILGSGTKNMPVEKMAEKIYDTLNDSDDENRVEKLLALKGVGTGKALAIAAALELGRRRSSHLKACISCPKDVTNFVRNYAVCEKEHFLMISLNGGHEIIKIHLVSVGTSNYTIIHARDVFKEAIKDNASSIVVCHNHPSGKCYPSEEDVKTTRRLIKASEIIGIPLLDHIIFGVDSYYSFVENGRLFDDEEHDDESDRELEDFMEEAIDNVLCGEDDCLEDFFN